MGCEFVGISRTAKCVHVCRTPEEPSCSPRIAPAPPYRVLRCLEFEQHVHIFAGFLIPTERVRLNFHFQRRKASDEVLKQRREYLAGHSQRARDLDRATWVRAANSKEFLPTRG